MKIKNSIRFAGASIITESAVMYGDIFVKDGSICLPFANPEKVIDCKGIFLAAGLIDLQVNGTCGVDFSNEDLNFDVVSKELLQYGVTSFLATIISRPLSFYANMFNNLPRDFGTCLGFHLEGPCINKAYCGAHNAKCIIDSAEMAAFLHPSVKMITVAPELESAKTLIKECAKKGIISSCGHSEASYEQLMSAKSEGLSFATHLFNCMPQLHHRRPGIIGAVLADNCLPYSLICDGIHISPEVVRLAYKANPEGLTLVSDCNALLGCVDETARLGDRIISKIQEGILMGSTTGLLECVKNLISFTGCPIHEAFCAASVKPAKLLGIDKKKGRLQPGCDADIILLTDSLELKAVFTSSGGLFLQ